VHKIAYTVAVDNKTEASWEVQPLSGDKMAATVAADYPSQLEIWLNVTSIIREVYIQAGKINATANQDNIRRALAKSWANATKGMKIIVVTNFVLSVICL